MKTREQQLKDYLIERNVGLDSLEANSIREGADWQKDIDDKECETMVGAAVKEACGVFIDKACRWLTEHYYTATHKTDGKYTVTEVLTEGPELLSTAFRKAMEAHFANAGKIEHSTLTWQDVWNICKIAEDLELERMVYPIQEDDLPSEKRREEFYTEVLTRFNNQNTNK